MITYQNTETTSKIKLNKDEIRYFQENPCEAIETFLDFKLDEQQKVAINNIHNNQFNVIKGSRNTGMTTIQMAYLAYQFYFLKPQEYTLVASHSGELSQYMKDLFIKYLTKINLQIQLGELNLKNTQNRKDLTCELIFKQTDISNTSHYRFVKATSDNIRGCTYSQIVVDCAAFSEIHKLLSQSNSKVKITLSSTPTNKKTDFYRYYNKNNQLWTITSLYWYKNSRVNQNLIWKKGDEVAKYGSPEYLLSKGYKPTNDWYQEMCRILGYNKQQITTELDCEFYDEPEFLHVDDWYSNSTLKGNFQFKKYDVTTIRDDYEEEYKYTFNLPISVLNKTSKEVLAEKLKQDFLSFINK